MRSTSLRQTSSTVMLRQVAGLLVHASRCTQRWPVRVHATPDVITLSTSGHDAWCLRRLGHRLFSCRLVAASEFVGARFPRAVRDMCEICHHGTLWQTQARKPLSILPLERLGEPVSFNLDASSLSLSVQQHTRPFPAQQSQTHANHNRERPSLQESASKV